MKVLMIGPARSVKGGISAVVNNYYQAGLNTMVELQYLSTMEDGNKLHKLKVAILALIKYPFMVVKADMVHIHMASDRSLMRKLPFIILSKCFGKKIVVQQHGGNFSEYFHNQCSVRRQKLIRIILNMSDLFLVVAPHLEREFKALLEPSKVYLFQNTILIAETKKKNYKEKNLVFLGRLCKEKGIRELLETVISMKKEYPDLHLYMAGVWEEEELRQRADAYPEFIHQLGWIGTKEKEEVLQKCNIFVLPTYFEGMPISLLEAMSYGCACVASKVGGIPDVIRQKQEGILIEPKNIESLKNALEFLFNDSEAQQNMGEAAVKRIREEYNLEQQLQQLINWYKIL